MIKIKSRMLLFPFRTMLIYTYDPKINSKLIIFQNREWMHDINKSL
jgi:hypothetical protein